MALPLCAACAEAAHGPLAGASDAWASAPTPAPAPAPAAASSAWAGYAELRALSPANAAPFTSRGHQPGESVDVRANAVASASYAALVTDTVFPEGSLLAELSRSGGHGYVMSKTGGAWTYLELGAQGQLLASGALPLCVGCHAQAPADRVFGLPRSL